MILRHRLHATIVKAPRPDKPAYGDVCWADGHCASEKVASGGIAHIVMRRTMLYP
jgi:prepilin-type processing-associated H-X9-DG protein